MICGLSIAPNAGFFLSKLNTVFRVAADPEGLDGGCVLRGGVHILVVCVCFYLRILRRTSCPTLIHRHIKVLYVTVPV